MGKQTTENNQIISVVFFSGVKSRWKTLLEETLLFLLTGTKTNLSFREQQKEIMALNIYIESVSDWWKS